MTVYQSLPKRLPTTSYDRIARITAAGGGDVSMHAVVWFDGQIDAEALKKSVMLMFDQEPVLSYRYVDRPLIPFWERAEAKAPIVKYVGDELEKEILIDEFLREPLHYDRSCQVDVRLFRSEKDTLCINASHVAMDGIGLIDYISLVASNYRRFMAALEPELFPRSERDRSPRQILKYAGVRALLRSMFHFRMPTFTWGLPTFRADLSGRRVLLRTLEENRLKSIIDYAHRHRVTVNDVLVTAFYRAMVEYLDPPWDVPLPLLIASDLRKHLPSNRAGALCNLSGGLFPVIRRKEEAFDETLARVHLAMDKEKKRDPGLAEMFFMDLAFSLGFPLARGILPKLGMFLARPALSNMGATDPDGIDFGPTKILNIAPLPPLTVAPFFGFVVNSFKGRLNIATAYCDTVTDPELPVRILDRFIEGIPGG